jgi:hypothetical protein
VNGKSPLAIGILHDRVKVFLVEFELLSAWLPVYSGCRPSAESNSISDYAIIERESLDFKLIRAQESLDPLLYA